MAPCGWVRPDGTGHTVAFVVMRQAAEFFSVSIINPCGEGVEYHAQEADPARGKVSTRTLRHQAAEGLLLLRKQVFYDSNAVVALVPVGLTLDVNSPHVVPDAETNS